MDYSPDDVLTHFTESQTIIMHYMIRMFKPYLIKDVAKLFSKNIKYIKNREGERFASAMIKSIRGKKIINLTCKMALEDYVNNFKKKVRS